MTENQKQIVLQALCEGLPYGLLCDRLGVAKKLFSVSPYEVYCLELDNGEYMPSKYKLEDIKPYLRPLSSMTEEEKKEISELLDASIEIDTDGNISYFSGSDFIPCSDYQIYIDYLISHHFDYRGLIEAGLALESPEGMYEIK